MSGVSAANRRPGRESSLGDSLPIFVPPYILDALVWTPTSCTMQESKSVGPSYQDIFDLFQDADYSAKLFQPRLITRRVPIHSDMVHQQHIVPETTFVPRLPCARAGGQDLC
jgi:hypothetical protein